MFIFITSIYQKGYINHKYNEYYVSITHITSSTLSHIDIKSKSD